MKLRDSYCKRILQDVISEKKEQLSYLKTRVSENDSSLRECTTWMKYQIIKFSINRLLEQEADKTTKRHQKKIDALIINKRVRDGISNNPNNLITNLTGVE